jgi:hypothetical protein
MDWPEPGIGAFALAVLLLASCTSTRGLPPGQDPRIAYFQKERQEIRNSESRCIAEASASSDHEIASIPASPGASESDRRQQLMRERNESLDGCRTNAARQREALSERERKAYQDDAQKERSRDSLMMIFISGPH